MAAEPQQTPVNIPSRYTAILQGRCPRCRTGKLMKGGGLFSKSFGEMNESCPHCNQDFVIEPGFYWGAMYISYAINVAVIVTCLVVYFVLFSEYSEFYLIGVIVTLIAILIPVNYRVSKILMIHFFSPVRFDPKYINQVDVANLDVDFKKNQELGSGEED